MIVYWLHTHTQRERMIMNTLMKQVITGWINNYKMDIISIDTLNKALQIWGLEYKNGISPTLETKLNYFKGRI